MAGHADVHAKTGREAYHLIIEHVLKNGRPRGVRGHDTLDAGFTTVLLDSPLDAMPVGCGRRLVPAIGAAEALQLIGQFSDPELMIRISPHFQQFIDGDGFHGAYGRRIGKQLFFIMNALSAGDTRQAVINLWDHRLDNLQNMRDYPCTVALQFQIEDAKLCMNTIMRSNDVWLGLPYDMFQFTQLQLTLAAQLGLAYGWYRHTALSMHAYERDVDGLQLVHAPTDTVFLPLGVGMNTSNFHSATNLARRLARACEWPDEKELTLSDKWYRRTLSRYVR